MPTATSQQHKVENQPLAFNHHKAVVFPWECLVTGCPSLRQPARIREEILESGNLFSGSLILPSYRMFHIELVCIDLNILIRHPSWNWDPIHHGDFESSITCPHGKQLFSFLSWHIFVTYFNYNIYLCSVYIPSLKNVNLSSILPVCISCVTAFLQPVAYLAACLKFNNFIQLLQMKESWLHNITAHFRQFCSIRGASVTLLSVPND